MAAPLRSSPLAMDDPPRIAPQPLWESLREGWTDLDAGLRRWDYWALLGWYDILQRYRRSTLGPLWLTLSMGVTIMALGVVYSALFQLDVVVYLPFLTIGFIIWAFVSSQFIEGGQTFIQAEGLIRQVRLPYSIHVFRTVWRGIIVLTHNAVVYVAVAFWFGLPVGWVTLLVIPGLAFLVLNALWISAAFGLLCARFRDVPPIATSIVQLAFFVTPVIWKPELLADRHPLLLLANPFHHAIELVRGPLLGYAPSTLSWAVTGGIGIAGCLLAVAAIGRFARRVPFWF
jgi:ABC-type polysaccharide/polyol phosphate export permease